ncbi:mitochondrial carrier domain-containing protein [Cyathus striatus]|nr:mitochondrial carrier domain-containing protein [Cyathus striatus]
MSFKEAAKDIAFGSIAGMVSEIFEYPFDLAKVRLQAQLLAPGRNTLKRFNGPLDCLMQTWRDEGIRGMYRGLPAPIVGSMAETAALFVSYGYFQHVVRNYWPSSSNEHSGPLTLPQLTVAAAGAGFVTSFFLTPIELVKCKMQVQMMNMHPTLKVEAAQVTPKPIPRIFSPTAVPNNAAVLPTSSSPLLQFVSNTRISQRDTGLHSGAAVHPPGPLSIIRYTVEAHGIRGLWLGHTGTALRETGGSAVWFVAKEWIAGKMIDRRLLSTYGTSPTNVPAPELKPLPFESAVSGAIAGALGALVLYPADTVKSAMQTEEELRPTKAPKPVIPHPSGFKGTFTRMYNIHGIRGLYAGCGMTVARAVPTSGIIFMVYDGLTAWFG